MTPTDFVPALPTLDATTLLPSLGPGPRLAFPLDRALADGHAPPTGDGEAAPVSARLYYLARNGVYHGLRAHGIGPGTTVLMPAYHHGVEVEAVRATGAAIAFYRVDRRFAADLDDVRWRVRADRTIRALYLTHVAGWPQPVAAARRLCDELGLLLVEDCALALFSRGPGERPLGSDGDLAVFCLYKTLPVPHGGVALARVPLPAGKAPPLLSTLHHVGGAALARAAMAGGRPLHAMRELLRHATRRTVDKVVKTVQVGTQHLKVEELDLGVSALARRILARTDAEAIVVRRRRNLRRLVEQLGDERLCAPGLPPPGVSPLFLPLVVKDRRRALDALWARGIEAIDFWSFGDPACDAAEFPDATGLRRAVIEIPIHQDLDDEAIDRVARTVKEVLAHG